MNQQHQQFINEYFANGMNATKAYIKVYPNSTYKSANSNASRLLVNDSIQIAIQNKFNELQTNTNTTINNIIRRLWLLADECEQTNDRTNQLKALDQLAKMIGAYAPKRIEQTAPIPLKINIVTPPNTNYLPTNDNLFN